MLRWSSAFLLGLALTAPSAWAAGPYLIADLNTARTVPAEPAARPGADSAELGGFLYFAADDGLHGVELWRTDGTGEGTALVGDVCPGPCSSRPATLTRLGNAIAFVASDGVHGREIWISDGTRAGTRMPRELCPGACSSVLENGPRRVAIGGRLFFVVRSAQSVVRTGLAVTDGTPEGTRVLIESDLGFKPIGEVQGRLAFLGPGQAYTSALWWSDGTPDGTSPAFDLCASPVCSSSWEQPYVVGNRIVFFRYDGENLGTWSTDGTPGGTRKIGDALPPFLDSSALWKGALYFGTIDGLWRTDGTPAGTRRIRAFSLPNQPHSLVPLDDELLFLAGDPQQGETLWRTRGTPGTTTILSDPAPGQPSPVLGPLTRVGKRAFFPVVWHTSSEIWETNGTAEGTRLLARVCGQRHPLCRLGLHAPASPAAVGETYLFGLAEEEHGFELWTADAAGPRLVRDIQRNAGSSRFQSMTTWAFGQPSLQKAQDAGAVGNRLVFSARTTPGGTASLWASDGTAAGTAEIGPEIPWPHGFTKIGDRLWLRGSSNPLPYLFGKGLWVTDGTPAGTAALAPELALFSLPGGRPDLVLFGTLDEQLGSEPWVSDGTPDGTGLLKDVNTQLVPPFFPGDSVPGSSEPALFTSLGSAVLFAADDGVIGREPWITDGTAAGTRLLLEINPMTLTDGITSKPGSSWPGPFVRFGDRAFFAADDGVQGRELWSTDGTTAGTVRARDLYPGLASSNPRDLVAAGTRLFFLADAGASDALFTVSPTGQVTRVRLLGNHRRASNLIAAGSRLFFVVEDPATGRELWTSDGTRPGTRLVREIRPGALGAYPQELTAVDGLLLFAADDGVHGQEPWVSDGTAAGTRLLADLAPGVDASGPANFSVAGDLVGFDADDGVHGREMWAVRKGDLAKP